MDMQKKPKHIGNVGVDAGLIWIGDPCYVLPDDATENPGADWSAFCDALGDAMPTEKSFNFKRGHEGAGICISSGYGDGVYPVFATYNDEGRIASVTVQFIGSMPSRHRHRG